MRRIDMTQHTPTPYTLDTEGDPSVIIAGPTEVFIASVSDPLSQLPITDEDYANAAFIVRACNCFDDMLEALDFLLPLVRVEKARLLTAEGIKDLDNFGQLLQKARGEV